MRSLALCALLLLSIASHAFADEPQALFALIIGVNKSVDAELPPLRYADDDAARYQDLFRSLGARTYLVSRLDENTSRLHPQAAAEARAPRRHELMEVVSTLRDDIGRARDRQVRTILYLIYSGHGNVSAGQGYLALEDDRLGAREIGELIDRAAADQVHVIVDACYSYFLALGRGPGGVRRPVSGFSELSGLGRRDSVGLLLSTSSARESHEWSDFQAGVFSHEVRSGLYGAADADGDGQVSYREIAAFVERANAAIANERFRPDVYARAPRRDSRLVDLRGAPKRRLEIDRTEHSHYLLEDRRGVRFAEFHSGAEQQVRLVLPAASGPIYVRRTDNEKEYLISGSGDTVKLAELVPAEPRVHPRGAANEAFGTIFALPFDEHVVQSFVPRVPVTPRPPRPSVRRIIGAAILGLSAAALTVALGVVIDAARLRAGVGAADSQQAAAQANDAITARNLTGAVLFSITGAAALSGGLLTLWPEHQLESHDSVGPGSTGSTGIAFTF